MKLPDCDLVLRLLFVLHRGWIEARILSLNKNSQQMFDLADALETIPCMLSQWKAGDLEAIRENLETYSKKYPDTTFSYLSYLEGDRLPEF